MGLLACLLFVAVFSTSCELLVVLGMGAIQLVVSEIIQHHTLFF